MGQAQSCGRRRGSGTPFLLEFALCMGQAQSFGGGGANERGKKGPGANGKARKQEGCGRSGTPYVEVFC